MKRDVRLDGLRVIGLLAIVLAHVFPPPLLYQLRNFDVPLMVLVSGAAFGLSSGPGRNYTAYIISRFRRLIIPTWIFLTIYFVIILLLSLSGNHPFPYSEEAIIKSYTLISGMGYVWIIRVFALVAAVIPFLFKLYNKTADARKYLLALSIIYLVYEFLSFVYSGAGWGSIGPLNFIIQDVLFYTMSYGVVAGLGIYIGKTERKSIGLLALLFLVIFVVFAAMNWTGKFTPTQDFKYPPRIYYLSYALFVSLSLYLAGSAKWFRQFFSNKLMLFISSSSLWIYLWHLFFLYETWGKINSFLWRYIVVLTLAVLTTYLQKRVVSWYCRKLEKHKALKSLIEDSLLK